MKRTAPPAPRCFFSTDLDEVHEVVARTQHPIRAHLQQRSPSFRFHVQHSHVQNHALAATALTCVAFEYDGRYAVDAPPIGTHYHVQVPVAGSAVVEHAGTTVTTCSGDRGVVLSPDRPTRWTSRGGFREVTLNLDRHLLEERWRRLTGHAVQGTIHFTPALSLDSAAGRRLTRQIRRIHGLLRRRDGDASLPVIAQREEDELVNDLLLGLPHDHSRPVQNRNRRGDRQCVAAAETLVLAKYDAPLTVESVARALDVSVRTLQRAFFRCRSYTPREFLKRTRLDRVRTRLESGDPALNVTRAAMDHGFRHLGLFSVDYRRFFGEPPSATLRRARSRSAVSCR